MTSPSRSSSPFPGQQSVVTPPKLDIKSVQGTEETSAEKAPPTHPKRTQAFIRSTIIDEPLSAELKIAIDSQNFKKGAYKKILTTSKAPINTLFEILKCQRLLPEERKAMQEYHDEAIAIYLDSKEGEKDISEYICQETWDALMDVFTQDAKIHQTGVAKRSLNIFDDDGKYRGWVTIYRDDTYMFKQVIYPPFRYPGKERDEAKWAVAVEFLKKGFEEKGLKMRELRERNPDLRHERPKAEFNSALRLEFES